VSYKEAVMFVNAKRNVLLLMDVLLKQLVGDIVEQLLVEEEAAQ